MYFLAIYKGLPYNTYKRDIAQKGLSGDAAPLEHSPEKRGYNQNQNARTWLFQGWNYLIYFVPLLTGDGSQKKCGKEETDIPIKWDITRNGI